MFKHAGRCPICERSAQFTSKNSWFRDNLICSHCKSIPRERALMEVIKKFCPNYQELTIHESSPANRGVSLKLKKECPGYTASQYYSNINPGKKHFISGFRCENLEALTFDDGSFDLFITQDVAEHLFAPGKAFKEIARVLRPGGAHIFSAPLVNKHRKSEPWASRSDSGEITYHHPAEYHGNPIDSRGSLVTMHWGYDIATFISQVANTPTLIVMIDNIDLGIQAEYIDIMVSWKN
jgi:SAM-dependent methyltransferase